MKTAIPFPNPHIIQTKENEVQDPKSLRKSSSGDTSTFWLWLRLDLHFLLLFLLDLRFNART
jgi:hypothetical protein